MATTWKDALSKLAASAWKWATTLGKNIVYENTKWKSPVWPASPKKIAEALFANPAINSLERIKTPEKFATRWEVVVKPAPKKSQDPTPILSSVIPTLSVPWLAWLWRITGTDKAYEAATAVAQNPIQTWKIVTQWAIDVGENIERDAGYFGWPIGSLASLGWSTIRSIGKVWQWIVASPETAKNRVKTAIEKWGNIPVAIWAWALDLGGWVLGALTAPIAIPTQTVLRSTWADKTVERWSQLFTEGLSSWFQTLWASQDTSQNLADASNNILNIVAWVKWAQVWSKIKSQWSWLLNTAKWTAAEAAIQNTPTAINYALGVADEKSESKSPTAYSGLWVIGSWFFGITPWAKGKLWKFNEWISNRVDIESPTIKNAESTPTKVKDSAPIFERSQKDIDNISLNQDNSYKVIGATNKTNIPVARSIQKWLWSAVGKVSGYLNRTIQNDIFTSRIGIKNKDGTYTNLTSKINDIGSWAKRVSDSIVNDSGVIPISKKILESGIKKQITPESLMGGRFSRQWSTETVFQTLDNPNIARRVYDEQITKAWQKAREYWLDPNFVAMDFVYQIHKDNPKVLLEYFTPEQIKLFSDLQNNQRSAYDFGARQLNDLWVRTDVEQYVRNSINKDLYKEFSNKKDTADWSPVLTLDDVLSNQSGKIDPRNLSSLTKSKSDSIDSAPVFANHQSWILRMIDYAENIGNLRSKKATLDLIADIENYAKKSGDKTLQAYFSNKNEWGGMQQFERQLLWLPDKKWSILWAASLAKVGAKAAIYGNLRTILQAATWTTRLAFNEVINFATTWILPKFITDYQWVKSALDSYGIIQENIVWQWVTIGGKNQWFMGKVMEFSSGKPVEDRLKVAWVFQFINRVVTKAGLKTKWMSDVDIVRTFKDLERNLPVWARESLMNQLQQEANFYSAAAKLSRSGHVAIDRYGFSTLKSFIFWEMWKQIADTHDSVRYIVGNVFRWSGIADWVSGKALQRTITKTLAFYGINELLLSQFWWRDKRPDETEEQYQTRLDVVAAFTNMLTGWLYLNDIASFFTDKVPKGIVQSTLEWITSNAMMIPIDIGIQWWNAFANYFQNKTDQNEEEKYRVLQSDLSNLLTSKLALFRSFDDVARAYSWAQNWRDDWSITEQIAKELNVTSRENTDQKWFTLIPKWWSIITNNPLTRVLSKLAFGNIESTEDIIIADNISRWIYKDDPIWWQPALITAAETAKWMRRSIDSYSNSWDEFVNLAQKWINIWTSLWTWKDPTSESRTFSDAAYNQRVMWAYTFDILEGLKNMNTPIRFKNPKNPTLDETLWVILEWNGLDPTLAKMYADTIQDKMKNQMKKVDDTEEQLKWVRDFYKVLKITNKKTAAEFMKQVEEKNPRLHAMMIGQLAEFKLAKEKAWITDFKTELARKYFTDILKETETTQATYNAIYQNNIRNMAEYTVENIRKYQPLMTSTSDFIAKQFEWIAQEIKKSNDPTASEQMEKLQKIDKALSGMFSWDGPYSMFLDSIANSAFDGWFRPIIDSLYKSRWVDDLRNKLPFLTNSYERQAELNWQRGMRKKQSDQATPVTPATTEPAWSDGGGWSGGGRGVSVKLPMAAWFPWQTEQKKVSSPVVTQPVAWPKKIVFNRNENTWKYKVSQTDNKFSPIPEGLSQSLYERIQPRSQSILTRQVSPTTSSPNPSTRLSLQQLKSQFKKTKTPSKRQTGGKLIKQLR